MSHPAELRQRSSTAYAAAVGLVVALGAVALIASFIGMLMGSVGPF